MSIAQIELVQSFPGSLIWLSMERGTTNFRTYLRTRFEEATMFCSGCGQTLAPGQGLCPQCGRPAVAPVPSVPGLGMQLEIYAGKVKALSIVWFIYAGLALVTGIVGLTVAR
jgi:hypothetical protein